MTTGRSTRDFLTDGFHRFPGRDGVALVRSARLFAFGPRSRVGGHRSVGRLVALFFVEGGHCGYGIRIIVGKDIAIRAADVSPRRVSSRNGPLFRSPGAEGRDNDRIWKIRIRENIRS